MDSKTFGIGILSLMAVVLLVANYLAPQPTIAAEAVKERDYIMVTARGQRGGEVLYVVDNRTGLMAVFVFDQAAGTIRPAAVRPVSDAFQLR